MSGVIIKFKPIQLQEEYMNKDDWEELGKDFILEQFENNPEMVLEAWTGSGFTKSNYQDMIESVEWSDA